MLSIRIRLGITRIKKKEESISKKEEPKTKNCSRCGMDRPVDHFQGTRKKVTKTCQHCRKYFSTVGNLKKKQAFFLKKKIA